MTVAHKNADKKVVLFGYSSIVSPEGISGSTCLPLFYPQTTVAVIKALIANKDKVVIYSPTVLSKNMRESLQATGVDTKAITFLDMNNSIYNQKTQIAANIRDREGYDFALVVDKYLHAPAFKDVMQVFVPFDTPATGTIARNQPQSDHYLWATLASIEELQKQKDNILMASKMRSQGYLTATGIQTINQHYEALSAAPKEFIRKAEEITTLVNTCSKAVHSLYKTAISPNRPKSDSSFILDALAATCAVSGILCLATVAIIAPGPLLTLMLVCAGALLIATSASAMAYRFFSSESSAPTRSSSHSASIF